MTATCSWPATRPRLLARIQDPNAHEAWNTFVEIYVPLIYRYCRKHNLQDADARDVVQDVLCKVQRFEYRPERGQFRGWLATVTSHEIARLLRKRTRPGQTPNASDPDAIRDAVADPQPDGAWTPLFHARVLEAALARIRPEFKDQTWRAFLAVALEEVAAENGQQWAWRETLPPGLVQQVADACGQPVTWVYRVKCRVFQRLKDEILDIAGEMAVFD